MIKFIMLLFEFAKKAETTETTETGQLYILHEEIFFLYWPIGRLLCLTCEVT